MDYKEFVWLFNSGNLPESTDNEIDTFFIESCLYGHLDIVKSLWNISGHKINIHATNLAFEFSCQNGHLEVAKWLLDISGHKIDIHSSNEYAFITACENGHLVVAKWLWDISDHKINIHVKNNTAFRWICAAGHLDIAKWLWVISKHTIPFYLLKKYRLEMYVLNTLSKKYRYKYTDTYDNLHMLHHYYKPVDGPGYLQAINDKN